MPISAITEIANYECDFNAEDDSQFDSTGGLATSWTEPTKGRSFTFQAGKPLVWHDFLGKRCLRFVGAGTVGAFLRCDALAAVVGGAFTAFAVGAMTVSNEGTGRNFLGWGHSGQSVASLLEMKTVSTLWRFERRNDSGVLHQVTSPGAASTIPALYEIADNGSQIEFLRNGVLLNTAVTRTGTVTPNQFAIGCGPRSSVNAPSDGLIFRLVVFSSYLSGTNRTDVRELLTSQNLPTVSNVRTFPSSWPVLQLPKSFQYFRVGNTFTQSIDLDANGRYTGSAGKYWVDWVNGSDSNIGSEAAPFKTISKALAQTDLIAIVLADGLHPATGGTPSWNTTYTRAERSYQMWATTRAIIANAENSIVNGWTLQTGSTWKTTRTTATTRVVDLTWLDSDNVPQQLTSRSSIALVDANPGSYFSDSITGQVYVRLFDSRTPDANVVVVIGSITPRASFTGTNRAQILDNLTFVGLAAGAGAQSGQYDFANCAYYFNNVHYWYGTEWSFSNAYEVVRDNCRGFNLQTDVNDYRGGATGIEVGFEGKLSTTADADNVSTCHTSSACIRFGGVYKGGPRPIHDINSTNGLIVDCDIEDATDNGNADTGVGVSAGLDDAASHPCNITIEGSRITNSDTAELIANNGSKIVVLDEIPQNLRMRHRGNGQLVFPARRRLMQPGYGSCLLTQSGVPIARTYA